MTENQIEEIEVVPVDGPEGPTMAMLIGVDIADAASAPEFVRAVLERFKLHRMISPPETSMLLITLIGDFSAGAFAEHWKAVAKADATAQTFMSQMVVADVIQGTPSGEQLSSASLLDESPASSAV